MMKRRINELIRQPLVNSLIRKTVKPVAKKLPIKLIHMLPTVGVVETVLPNGKVLKLNNNGYDYIASRIYWRGLTGFEGSTIKLFAELLSKTKVFLDIGANTGLFSLIAGHYDSLDRIVAFEPVSRVRNLLEENIKLNELEDRITVVNSALTDFDGELDFYVPNSPVPTSASEQSGFKSNTKQVKVRAQKLDSVFSRLDLPSLDLIKVDTETTEYLVLIGGQKTIAKFTPYIFCEILPQGQAEKIEELTKPLGYKYYWISESGLKEQVSLVGHERRSEMNYLFVPPTRYVEFRNLNQ